MIFLLAKQELSIQPDLEGILRSNPNLSRLAFLWPGTQLHQGFLVALVLAVIAWVYLSKTAAGFALRITCPLAGREVPNLPQALGPRLAVARAMLGAMTPAEFDGAETRMIRHKAGFAEIEQTGTEFLHLYGMPNFFFHLTMGYAALRAAGVPLGKADFDGFHSYPRDFSF